MKKLVYIIIVFVGFIVPNVSKAQVSLNINIGSQPLWGPVGYEYARFYYLPEIEVYYDVAARKYTYYQGNRWVTKSRLPSRFRKFDIYKTYKVVLNDSNPWRYHNKHRSRYARYIHIHNQVVLRDSHRSKNYRKHRPSVHPKHKMNKHKKGNRRNHHRNH